jgi:hypothetical protein
VSAMTSLPECIGVCKATRSGSREVESMDEFIDAAGWREAETGGMWRTYKCGLWLHPETAGDVIMSSNLVPRFHSSKSLP